MESKTCLYRGYEVIATLRISDKEGRVSIFHPMAPRNTAPNIVHIWRGKRKEEARVFYSMLEEK